MALMDEINRLRSIQPPTQSIQFVMNVMFETNAEVAGIVGPSLISTLGINVTAQAVQDHLTAALRACEEYKSAVNDAADALQQAGG